MFGALGVPKAGNGVRLSERSRGPPMSSYSLAPLLPVRLPSSRSDPEARVEAVVRSKRVEDARVLLDVLPAYLGADAKTAEQVNVGAAHRPVPATGAVRGPPRRVRPGTRAAAARDPGRELLEIDDPLV